MVEREREVFVVCGLGMITGELRKVELAVRKMTVRSVT